MKWHFPGSTFKLFPGNDTPVNPPKKNLARMALDAVMQDQTFLAGYATAKRPTQLHKLQSPNAQLICNLSRFESITPTLMHLHWLPVKRRIKDFKSKILLITFKVIYQPSDELITVKASTRSHLRSKNDCYTHSRSSHHRKR